MKMSVNNHKEYYFLMVLGLFLVFTKINNLFSGGLINFSNTTSAIVVTNTGSLNINNLNNMNIDTGAIINSGLGSITGNNIFFLNGSYSFFNSTSALSGTILDPTTNTFILQTNPDIGFDGGTLIANPGGLAGTHIQAGPGSNILRGQPLFFGIEDVVLNNNTTLLAIAIQNTLNTNIRLNGGILFLQDDLRLGNDAIIVDNGQVVLNNRRLSLGGSSSNWSGTILWNGAQDLQINSTVNLAGKWIFFGDGQINGNGNVIDLATGGSIIVLDNSSLRLSDVQIKSLGSIGSIKLGKNAILYLTNVGIEMDDDYIFDSGTIFVEGDSHVTTKDHILSFQDNPNGQTNGKLVVDRVALTYDTLATLDRFNIQPPLILDPTHKYIEILGQGDIRTIRGDTVTFHNYRAQSLLQKYAIVAPYRKFIVHPEIRDDGSFNFDVLIDGNTNFLGFTRTDEKSFFVADRVKATTQNIFLRDLSPNHFSFGTQSSIIFGNHTTIAIAKNDVLNYPWIFQGETILKGAGNVLELGPNGAIILQGTNSTLLLDGISITGIQGQNVACTDTSNSISLKNVKWIQNGDFSYKKGSLTVANDSIMQGISAANNTNKSNFIFSYQSNQPLSILSYATLSLIRNMIFEYNPQNKQSDLFVLTDPSAALYIDQATLRMPVNMTLDTGQFIIRERNFISGSLTKGPNLFMDRPNGAILENEQQ